MYEICGEKTNFSPLILHIFPIFLDPGGACVFAIELLRNIKRNSRVIEMEEVNEMV